MGWFKPGHHGYPARAGIWESIRRAYHKERTPARNKEMEQLCLDVDYLINELRRLENRTAYYNLVSAGIIHLCMKLRYWETRKKYKSDTDCFKAIAKEFYIEWTYARSQIMVHDVLNEKVWTETEGGLENDVYPQDVYRRRICPLCRRRMIYKSNYKVRYRKRALKWKEKQENADKGVIIIGSGGQGGTGMGIGKVGGSH
jgi:hypothetical protein